MGWAGTGDWGGARTGTVKARCATGQAGAPSVCQCVNHVGKGGRVGGRQSDTTGRMGGAVSSVVSFDLPCMRTVTLAHKAGGWQCGAPTSQAGRAGGCVRNARMAVGNGWTKRIQCFTHPQRLIFQISGAVK